MLESEVGTADAAGLGAESSCGGENFKTFALGVGEGFLEPILTGAFLEIRDQRDRAVESFGAVVGGGFGI